MKRVFWIIVAVGLAELSSRAAVLVEYQFNNSSDYYAPSSVASDLSASDVTVGSGLPNGTIDTTTTTSPYIVSPSFSFVGTDLPNKSNGGSLNESITSDRYIGFTVTADTGTFSLDGGNVTLSLATSNGAGTEFDVQYSLDGGTTFTELIDSTTTGPFTTSASGTTTTISFSGTKFDSLSAISVRLYAFNTTGTQKNSWADNISLNGSGPAAPEPVNPALAIFGGLIVVGYGVRWFRRRRQKET